MTRWPNVSTWALLLRTDALDGEAVVGGDRADAGDLVRRDRHAQAGAADQQRPVGVAGGDQLGGRGSRRAGRRCDRRRPTPTSTTDATSGFALEVASSASPCIRSRRRRSRPRSAVCRRISIVSVSDSRVFGALSSTTADGAGRSGRSTPLRRRVCPRLFSASGRARPDSGSRSAVACGGLVGALRLPTPQAAARPLAAGDGRGQRVAGRHQHVDEGLVADARPCRPAGCCAAPRRCRR